MKIILLGTALLVLAFSAEGDVHHYKVPAAHGSIGNLESLTHGRPAEMYLDLCASDFWNNQDFKKTFKFDIAGKGLFDVPEFEFDTSKEGFFAFARIYDRETGVMIANTQISTGDFLPSGIDFYKDDFVRLRVFNFSESNSTITVRVPEGLNFGDYVARILADPRAQEKLAAVKSVGWALLGNFTYNLEVRYANENYIYDTGEDVIANCWNVGWYEGPCLASSTFLPSLVRSQFHARLTIPDNVRRTHFLLPKTLLKPEFSPSSKEAYLRVYDQGTGKEILSAVVGDWYQEWQRWQRARDAGVEVDQFALTLLTVEEAQRRLQIYR